MQLSENFSIAELTVTDTELYNTPGQVELEKLLYLANYILQPVRNKFGPIRINSGFRSKQVNEKIGGSATSQHCFGEAADIYPLQTSLEDVFQWIKENLVFGQLILERKEESRWLHVSLPRIGKQNQMAMTFENGVYKNV